jgi:hypothetical protein
LVPDYDDILGDRYPDHGGKIVIEFVGPTDPGEVIEPKPSPKVNGNRH